LSDFDDVFLRTLLHLADADSAGDEAAVLLERFAQRAVALLPAEACGVAAADEDGELSLLRCSDGDAWMLCLVQLTHEAGPLVDCFRTGAPVQCPDITAVPDWPELAGAARVVGVRAFTAVPLRGHDEVVGAACLMRGEPGPDSPRTLGVSRAMARSTAIGVTRARAARRDGRDMEYWNGALTRQITIDQACGIVAERRNLAVPDAALLIEQEARAQGIDVAELAELIVRGVTDRPRGRD
jgi:GAF domain-containing protein